MSELERLEQRIAEQKQQWQNLSGQIQLLNNERVHERVDERARLKSKIDGLEAERKQIEADLVQLERQRDQLQKDALIQQARDRERKKSYQAALEAWQQLAELSPDDTSIEAEIRRLQNKQKQAQDIKDAIRQLTRRMKQIGRI